jgi:hypothetical protein
MGDFSNALMPDMLMYQQHVHARYDDVYCADVGGESPTSVEACIEAAQHCCSSCKSTTLVMACIFIRRFPAPATCYQRLASFDRLDSSMAFGSASHISRE